MAQSTRPQHTSVPQALRRMKNGTSIHRLTLGVFPDVLRRQLSTARKYRAELEQFVLDAKGEVRIVDSHYIDQAAAAEVHSAICRLLMRQKWDKMSVADVALCSKEIMKSKQIRNAAIEKLQLNRSANILDALYSVEDDVPQFASDEPLPDGPTESSSGAGDAAEANPGVES